MENVFGTKKYVFTELNTKLNKKECFKRSLKKKSNKIFERS